MKPFTFQMRLYQQKIVTSRPRKKKSDPNRPLSNRKQSHTSTHGHRWFEGKKKRTPPLIAVEEVVQAKIVEERTRRARELNLKVRGLPLPHPSSDPIKVGIRFLRDTLGIPDINLDRAWLGHDSTLFLKFRIATDRLCSLKDKRKLFSLPNKIFLDEDLTKAQVAELK